jgi:hypothetical protein
MKAILRELGGRVVLVTEQGTFAFTHPDRLGPVMADQARFACACAEGDEKRLRQHVFDYDLLPSER